MKQEYEEQLDKNKVYWFWYNGRQVQVCYAVYSRKWYAMFNDSGRAL